MKELVKQRIKFILEGGGLLGDQTGVFWLRLLTVLVAANVVLNAIRLLTR